MTLIAAPTFAIREIDWYLDRPAQVNRSGYSGSREVVANPWHGKWRATVTLKTEQGEENIRAMRGFLASLDGQVNSFLLPATEGAQLGAGAVTAAADAAQGATSITLSIAAAMTAGMFATVTLPSGNRQMVMLTQDIAGSTISFKPALREAVSAGAGIEIANPACEVALANSEFGWSVAQWRQYGISFDVEEAF